MNEARLNLSWLTGGFVPIMLALVAACGGASGSGAKAADAARPERLEHEDCPESSNRVDAMDTNGDGKPDIKRVLDKSGHELCRIGDLNHDGKPEMYEYFDASGVIRRREFCYDDTGIVNAVEHYEGGKLVRREYDAGGQRRIDTWDWFDPSVALDPKSGRPVHPSRRERDTTGAGHVDQWWTWNGDKVTIAVDSAGNGKPDPATAIVLGPNGAVDTSSPAASAPEGAGKADAGAGMATTVDGGKT